MVWSFNSFLFLFTNLFLMWQWFIFFFLPKSPLAAAATAAGRDKKKKLERFLFKFVSVLLSASVESVGVSRIRDFFKITSTHIFLSSLFNSDYVEPLHLLFLTKVFKSPALKVVDSFYVTPSPRPSLWIIQNIERYSTLIIRETLCNGVTAEVINICLKLACLTFVLTFHMFHSEILASWNFNKIKILSPGLEINHTLKCFFLAIFQHNHKCQDCWKNTRSTFEYMVILQSRGQGPDSCWKYGTDLSRSSPSILDLVPWIWE